MAGYVVTGPLAVVHDSGGKIRYLYAGAVLPDDVSGEEAERLVQRGLVEKTGGQPKRAATKRAAAATGSDDPPADEVDTDKKPAG